MARSAVDFAGRNTERAVQAADYGMSRLREIAKQNLNQSKTAAESLVIVTRKVVEALDQQASTIREQSMVAAEETLSNTIRLPAQALSDEGSARNSRRFRASSSAGRLRSSAIKPKKSGR